MFNPQIYKLFNNDLKNLNKNQLTIHWKTIGVKENRIYNINSFFQKYPDFNLIDYIKNNPNIKKYEELIIMSHYHHNINYNNEKISNKIVIDPKNENYLNIICEYLDKYYKFKYKLCFIIFELNQDLIFSLKNINNSQFNIYFINNIFNDYINDNIKDNIDNLKIIDVKNDFNILQSKLINLDYDYFYIPRNNNINLETKLIEKNCNIILNDNYIIIKKNLLKYYNFIDIYNIYNNQNSNKIIYNNKVLYIYNKYINSKFYDIIYNNEYNYKKNVYINLKINNLQDIYYLIKLINYFENIKYNVFLKSNNYNFFENYFDKNIIFDYKNISDLSEINFVDNYNISTIVNFENIKYNKLQKSNYKLISNVFENILFLDLKKNIIFIYLDNDITENFIINSLINLDFQNSIIITINLNKYKNKFNIFNYLSILDFSELFNNYQYNISDILIIFGYYIDYYIGYNNDLSIIWNYINSNIIFYLNDYLFDYFNYENIIINNNILNFEYMNNKLINYNSNLFILYENELLSIKKINSSHIDYYFNDYILKYFLSNKKYIENYKINNDIYIINNNNYYYFKYYDKIQLIENNFIIDNYKKFSIKQFKPIVNTSNIINNFVFVIKLSIININYYIEIFNKYYSNINYILEIYCSDQKLIEKYQNNNKININFLDDYKYIINDLSNKYNNNDLIFYIKNLNFNIFDINKDLLYFFIQDKLFIDRNDYICFNIYILQKKIYNKNFFDLVEAKFRENNFNNNLLYYTNNQYINNYKHTTNDSLLTKFLIYSENNYNIKINNDDILNYLFMYHVKYLIFYFNENLLYFYSDDFDEEKIFNIDLVNLNKIFNKIDKKIYIIYKYNDNCNILTLSNFNLSDQIIYDENDIFKCLIIDITNLKKIGFINSFYFKNNSMIEMNLNIFKKFIDLKIYQIISNNLKNYYIDTQIYIDSYFKNIKLDSIISIRNTLNINNLDNIYNNLIDIYIINLKNRTDKKIYMINEMNKHLINKYKFFNGIKINKNQIKEFDFIKPEKFLNNLNINYVLNSSGCKISHYNLIKSLINNNKYTLILEDDVVLEKNFYFHIIHSLKYITNFDILYLGCNLNNKDDAHLVSNNILKVLKPKTTTAYLIKNSNKNNILKTIENSDNEIDNCYSDSNLNKYCIYPMIAYQKDLSSDIVTESNYEYYHDKFCYL